MHWYTQTGEACHEVPNKSKPGQTRGTTVADARKLDLIPSVTSIMSCAASPGLTEWRIDQAVVAAIQNEGMNYFDIRKLADSKGKEAANEGTIIHDMMEHYLNRDGELVSADPDFEKFKHRSNIVNKAWDSIKQNFHIGNWKGEERFVHKGFAGSVDLHSKDRILGRKGSGVVIDFKTKGTNDTKKMQGYDTHLMQLAAYREGLGIPEAACYNMFISTTHPDVIVWKEWTEEELQRGYKMFLALKDFFYLSNKL